MKPRVLLVTTSPLIVNHFLLGHLRALSAQYEVTLAVNTNEPYALRLEGIDCTLQGIAIERKISPLRDLAAVIALFRSIRAGRFAVVHSLAPKAGLLAMLAAWLGRVPARVHTFQGEVWATRRGFMRQLLKTADRVSAALATHVLVVGEGERRFLVSEGVLREACASVLAKGSIAGVDLQRFKPDSDARARVRASLGVSERATLLLFLGRIARDKGVLDLAQAFRSVADTRGDVHLVIAGPDEDRLGNEIRAVARPFEDRLHCIGLVDSPQDLLAAADLLCLPSYREGFPNVVLEAAAVGIASLASRVYGVTDAIIDGRTGVLHVPADVTDIAAKLALLLDDPATRRRLGDAARERVRRDFDGKDVISAMVAFYDRLTGNAAKGSPRISRSVQARL